MGALMILIWDGFLIMGEGLGLQLARARYFADTCWVASATLFAVVTSTWVATLLATVT